MFLDPRLSSSTSFSDQHADYDKAIADNVQKVAGKKDTFFPWAFAGRSSIDTDYIQQLIDAGMITEEFARDVALVDFTRPVFSEERCALLAHVPLLATVSITATKL